MSGLSLYKPSNPRKPSILLGTLATVFVGASSTVALPSRSHAAPATSHAQPSTTYPDYYDSPSNPSHSAPSPDTDTYRRIQEEPLHKHNGKQSEGQAPGWLTILAISSVVGYLSTFIKKPGNTLSSEAPSGENAIQKTEKPAAVQHLAMALIEKPPDIPNATWKKNRSGFHGLGANTEEDYKTGRDNSGYRLEASETEEVRVTLTDDGHSQTKTYTIPKLPQVRICLSTNGHEGGMREAIVAVKAQDGKLYRVNNGKEIDTIRYQEAWKFGDPETPRKNKK